MELWTGSGFRKIVILERIAFKLATVRRSDGGANARQGKEDAADRRGSVADSIVTFQNRQGNPL